MRVSSIACAVAAAAVASLAPAAPALADFVGQTILGPLAPGSVVTGDNTLSSDNNDGFTSGDHFFFIWDGGDDAYRLDWPGGDLTVLLAYNNLESDPDLFLYRPSNLNDSSDYGITNLSPDVVTILGAEAGAYYVVVDSAAGFEGAYELTVLPAPGAMGLLAAGGVLAARRRRR